MFFHILILFESEFFWFLWFLLGVSYGEEVAPVEGIFYAKPALLDSDSDSEVDTDTDAQTVIYKSSPYSSPGSEYNFTTSFYVPYFRSGIISVSLHDNDSPSSEPPNNDPSATGKSGSWLSSPTPTTSTPCQLHPFLWPIQLPSQKLESKEEVFGILMSQSVQLVGNLAFWEKISRSGGHPTGHNAVQVSLGD